MELALPSWIRSFDQAFLAERRRGLHLAVVPVGGISAELSAWLTPQERRYFETLRFSKRQNEWLSGRLAAKAAILELLRENCDCNATPADVEILAGERGRPTVRLLRGVGELLQVSISHSGALAAAAASLPAVSGPIGLDVEREQEVDPAVHKIAFTPAEIAGIEASPIEQRTRLVLRLWTAKEAVLKAIGLGLNVPLTSVSMTPGELWAATVTVPETAERRFLVRTEWVSGYILSLAAPGQSALYSDV